MKIFLSWSGDRSYKFASLFRDWLPNVIQACKPWLSKEDISKGANWLAELSKELQESKAGILFLTKENIDAAWLLFEAGAISKTIDTPFVCPYLLDLKPTDISGPLSQFQAATVNEDDTLQLVKTINKALGNGALEEKQLDKIFKKWWPDLEKELKGIPPTDGKKKQKRTERELLEEILERVRSLGRQSTVLPEMGMVTGSFEEPFLSRQFLYENFGPQADHLLKHVEKLSVKEQKKFWRGMNELFRTKDRDNNKE